MKNLHNLLLLLLVVLFFNSCATYNSHIKTSNSTEKFAAEEIEHSFYLIGDAGNSELGSKSPALVAFQKSIKEASKNSTVLFLGDNIYPKGLPKKNSEGRELAKHRLDVQIDAVKDFNGDAIFIPGNHDWYAGIKGLKRQEKYVEDKLGKNTFLPENGCPLERVKISEDIDLIVIDSEWYITNWDLQPTINDNCEIKTRAKFYTELRGLIKKARGKTTIIALHHPMFTNGPHGGQYTFGSHMKPLPVLGTVKNILRRTSGVSPADLQHKRYNEFRKQVITLSQQNDKVIFVSGHEHSLQYLKQDNIPQIISGAGSKVTGTRNVGDGEFSYGTPGYARLDIFKDGSSRVQFHSVEENKIVYNTQVLSPDVKKEMPDFKTNFPATIKASIYNEEQTKKSGFYKFLWGDRYRKYFSTKVEVPTVNLDTLFGGLTPVRRGGGNQSKSLRMEDPKGREYVIRALKKNPSQYLQATIFKDQYVEGQFDDTFTENLLYDVFAGSHPYAPFVIGDLSDAVGVYHTNPVLYYIPKQAALGPYNDEYGDELYMIEERAANDHGDKASFGFSNDLISTDDILKKLHKDEDFIIDEASYIRARLFDMLIGDWDRHEDQWRWIKFKENGKTVYRPMPRDRDQAFSIMSDGFLLGAAVTLIPNARLLRKYDVDLKDVDGVNIEPYPFRYGTYQ
jgi:predicted phosphodiesterase